MHYNDVESLYRKGWNSPNCVWSNAAFFVAAFLPPCPSWLWCFTMWCIGVASSVFHATMDSRARVADNVCCALFEVTCLGSAWGWPTWLVLALWPCTYLAQIAVSRGFEVDAVLVFSNLFTLWWHAHYDVLGVVLFSFACWYQNMLGSSPISWCHSVFHVGMALAGHMLWGYTCP